RRRNLAFRLEGLVGAGPGRHRREHDRGRRRSRAVSVARASDDPEDLSPRSQDLGVQRVQPSRIRSVFGRSAPRGPPELHRLFAERIARRIGLLRTMVFTHVPSNVLLIAVAFAPTALGAVVLLLCRQSLSQMDVPTRQSYVMSIVDEEDRTAAAGLTSSTRTVSSSISPSLAGYALANLWLGTPLVAAGSFKLAYDLLIYRNFRKVRPP